VFKDLQNIARQERLRAPGWPSCLFDVRPRAREQLPGGGEEGGAEEAEEEQGEEGDDDSASLLKQDPEVYLDLETRVST